MTSWMNDTFTSILEAILNATLFKLLYYIEIAMCKIISILGDLFSVFSGVNKAIYDESPTYLINVFFDNQAVRNIYWAMALVGFALTLGFTIWGVVRKMFDASGKVQQSMGQILTGAVRSIVLIAGLTVLMNVVIYGTNKLMQVVDDIFNNAYTMHVEDHKDFTDEEYAAMGRVLATIGNYSMVTTSNNRYNLNICFNEIRPDMKWLQDQKVFEYSYYKEVNGQVVESWQSVLAQIARSTDLRRDVKVDVYNEGVVTSLTAAIDYLRNNVKVTPVPYVDKNLQRSQKVYLDRLVFLMGTMGAARNSTFNESPDLMGDPLRSPYYYGQGRDIYDLDDVNKDFNIGFPTDYIVVFFAGIAIIFDLVVIILNCIARIFNMLFLYIIAPPVIAASPMDSGGKFKQWSIAFLVQSLSVFGTVIAMRLLLIYLPIVLDPKLALFDPAKHPYLNMFAKFALVYGGIETTKKATSLLTGILADSAGWQSIQAGDMSGSAAKAIGTAKALGGKALSAAGSVASFATKPATNLIKRPFNAAGHWWSNLGSGNAQRRAQQAVKDEEMREKYRKKDDGSKPEPNQPENQNNQNNNNNNNNHPAPAQPPAAPPPLPNRMGPGDANEAPANLQNQALNQRRQQYGFGGDDGDGGGQGGGQGQGPANPPPRPRSRDDSGALPPRNRPHL